MKDEILIVCWDPCAGPWGERWRCRCGSVKISPPAVSIDQDTVEIVGGMWTDAASTIQQKKRKDKVFHLDKNGLLKTILSL